MSGPKPFALHKFQLLARVLEALRVLKVYRVTSRLATGDAAPRAKEAALGAPVAVTGSLVC